MSHWFDRLAREAAAEDSVRFDRRTTLKLAGAAALAAAAPATVANAQSGDPCLDCKQVNLDTFLKAVSNCRKHNIFAPYGALQIYACMWSAKIGEFTGRSHCKTTVCVSPPTPVPAGNPPPPTAPAPPPANGSVCPSGTSECPPDGGRTCCFGNDFCCPCAKVATGYICCIYADCRCC
jgi:hypothetical protein